MTPAAKASEETGFPRARLAAAKAAAGWNRGCAEELDEEDVSGGEGMVGCGGGLSSGCGGGAPGGGPPAPAPKSANGAPKGNLGMPGEGKRGLPGPSKGFLAPAAAAAAAAMYPREANGPPSDGGKWPP